MKNPWSKVDDKLVEKKREEVIALGNELVRRLNTADLSDALEYNSEYADNRCYIDKNYLALMKVRFAIGQFLHANDFYNYNLDLKPFLKEDRLNQTQEGTHVFQSKNFTDTK